MPDAGEIVEAILAAESWDLKVALIRRIPETFGTAQHLEVYSGLAKRLYVPMLAPDFAYVAWREDYELEPFRDAYQMTISLTEGFRNVAPERLAAVILESSITLRIFRLLIGFTPQEFAAATKVLAEEMDLPVVSPSKVKAMESGSGRASEDAAKVCAELIHRAMTGVMFEAPIGDLRSKIDKPDTKDGWETVAHYAEGGVPFDVFLHQRQYGGAFRQLLDATSTTRGNILEEPVQLLFEQAGVPFLRTGSHNQAEIERRFGLTVRPAPDFVVFDGAENLRAILECKGANDGGTARDKAARFRSLRTECMRLGGIPLVAVLGGLGWTRTADALGPVVRDTDGRVFTLSNLPEMLTVDPFPQLVIPS